MSGVNTVTAPPDGPLVSWPLVGLAGLAWVGAVAFPLATYTITLALFGLAHVATELTWVRRRFGGSLGAGVVPVLGGVALLRTLALVGLLPREVGRPLELLLAVLLVLLVAPRWWRPGNPSGGTRGVAARGLVVTVGLVVGLLWWPTEALLAVAVLHNWTPIPLVWLALEPRRRPAFLGLSVVLFGVLPLLAATGAPWALAGALGVGSVEAWVFPSGSLAANQGAYLPVGWTAWDPAQHLFSAVVFAQCLHYIVVIGVLPGLVPAGTAPIVPWRWPVLVGSAGLVLAYLLDFGLARSAYGVVSSVHAWIEVPLLVLALAPATSRG